MGIFDRAKGAVNRSADRIASGVENNNPEAVFEAAIEAATARLAEHRERVAAVSVRQARSRDKAAALELQLAEVLRTLHGVVADGDDEVAVVLIERKNELTAALEQASADAVADTDAIEQGKAALTQATQQLEALKRDKHVQLAQRAVADAAIDIYDATTGLSDNATHQGLASVREQVGRLERAAGDGYLDADGNSVRGRAEALGRKAAEASAREQLEALKAAHRATTEPDEGDEA